MYSAALMIIWGSLAGAAVFCGYVGWRVKQNRKRFGEGVRRIYNTLTITLPALLGLGAVLGVAAAEPGQAITPLLIPAAAAIILVFGRIYATHIERRLLLIRRITIRTPKMRLPLRIVHISDVESNEVRRHEPRVYKRINSLEPDLLLDTGDLLAPRAPATYASEVPQIRKLIESVKAPMGKFFVAGEADQPIIQRIRDGEIGMQLLENGQYQVPLDRQTISIYGLAFDQSRRVEETRKPVEEWLHNCRGNCFTILMGHRPDYILDVSDLQIDLCLAGHTHGGQVRIPFIGPLVTFSEVPREWARGFHTINNTFLHVTAGVGFEHGGGLPALRFLCPPEITLFEILPEHASGEPDADVESTIEG